MPFTDSFPTKRGTVRVTDDAVHIEESFSGYIQSLYAEYWKGDTWRQKAIFAGYVFAVVFGVWGIVNLIRSEKYLLIGTLVGLFILLWGLNYARGFRSPNRIPLTAINDVSATRGTKGLTRPRLIITYTDGKSTVKRRVSLPSLYTSRGEAAYERAQATFAERGF
ncbi:hypothetical protein [Halobellus sp. EA9]|uniref:hypothetical protein n=1 Tax=Halobellus sp. EA9 TaxID=3421647 RepID=UPI003EBFA570